jgi:hypothetical protein
MIGRIGDDLVRTLTEMAKGDAPVARLMESLDDSRRTRQMLDADTFQKSVRDRLRQRARGRRMETRES